MPLLTEEDEEVKPGKIKYKKPDKHLQKLPGMSRNPKQPPFRLTIAKSDMFPELIFAPMENFKGLVFIDSETLEIRRTIQDSLTKRPSPGSS